MEKLVKLALKAAFSGAALLGACYLVTSCGGEQIGTTKLALSSEYPLSEGRDDALSADVDVDFPVFEDETAASGKIERALVSALFGEKYADMEAAQAAESYMADLCVEYRADGTDILETEGLEDMTINWGDMVEGRLSCVRDGILSYIVDHYMYRGGAHGIQQKTAFNYDLRTGSRVTEEDFFKAGSHDRLSTLLTAKLPESLPSPECMDGLFVTEIEPNGNFYLSKNGVTYIYNQYEIAPYAIGRIEVTIPWEDLAELCK